MEYSKFIDKLLSFVNDNNTWYGKWDAAGLKRYNKSFLVLKEFSIKNWNLGNDNLIKEEDYFSNLSTIQLMNKIFEIYNTEPEIKIFLDKEFLNIN